MSSIIKLVYDDCDNHTISQICALLKMRLNYTIPFGTVHTKIKELEELGLIWIEENSGDNNLAKVAHKIKMLG